MGDFPKFGHIYQSDRKKVSHTVKVNLCNVSNNYIDETLYAQCTPIIGVLIRFTHKMDIIIGYLS